MTLLVVGIIALTAILSVSILAALALDPSGWVEFILFGYTAAIASVLVIGYTLSVFHVFGMLQAWSASNVGLFMLVSGVCILRGVTWQELRSRVPVLNLRRLLKEVASFPRAERWCIYALTSTVLVTFLLNLAVALASTPENVDSLNYHLARVAYYLQFQNLGHYQANFWAQIMHSNGSAVVLSFVFLATNRNENLMQLPQLAAYVVSLFAVYGTTRRIGGSRSLSWIAALIFGLLTEVLMEAVTTQNDLVLTACVGISTYGLFAYRDTRQFKFMVLTIIGLALAAATKVTILTLVPSLLLIAVYTLGGTRWDSAAQAARVGAWSISIGFLALILFVLPSGYLENYRVFGDPLGSKEIGTQTSPLDQPTGQVLANGSKNLIRLSLDFFSLDGFPPGTITRRIQSDMRALPIYILRALNLNLEEHPTFRAGFRYERPPRAHEDFSYWGILGFALLGPITLQTSLGFWRNSGAWILACAALLSIVAVAFMLYYEPFHGRRLITTGLFSAPAMVGFLTFVFGSRDIISPRMQVFLRVVRAYVLLIILLGCVSAVSAILFRMNSSIVPYYERSIFAMNRIEQLTRSHLENLQPLTKFEQLVPADAVVAVDYDRYEYIFFGKGLTRTLLPVGKIVKENLSLSSAAQFLLYAGKSPSARPHDISLGGDLYLRKLGDYP